MKLSQRIHLTMNYTVKIPKKKIKNGSFWYNFRTRIYDLHMIFMKIFEQYTVTWLLITVSLSNFGLKWTSWTAESIFDTINCTFNKIAMHFTDQNT